MAKKGTEVISDLISEAQSAGIHADYVLFDSWFSSPKVIRSMKEKDLDVVAMVKKSSKIHYTFAGQTFVLQRDLCPVQKAPWPLPISAECSH